MRYIEFASRISFYEFLQDEFRDPHFDVNCYKAEIELLSSNLNVEYLVKVFESNPKAIDVVEELLQLKRFTDAQYIHFCFDVNTLNNAEPRVMVRYIQEEVLRFENGSDNENLSNILVKIWSAENPAAEEVIFYTKRAIVKYVAKILKKRSILYDHLRNSMGARLRIARYLIESLNADRLISAVRLDGFLRQKRHPRDSKGLHGNFGMIKIKGILARAGLADITDGVKAAPLSAKVPCANRKGWSFVRERAVEGLMKRKDKKLKKFDFVLLRDGIPSLLVETNFYTTSGTKIGINQGEYVDLQEDVIAFNEEHGTAMRFAWVTDGNYWLSHDGETRFKNLKGGYFKGETALLNYKLFEQKLPEILECSG